MQSLKESVITKKIMATIIFTASLLSVVLAVEAYKTDILLNPDMKFTYQNTSVTLLVVAFVTHFLLAYLQDAVYEISTWFGKPKIIDERQNKVRNEVFFKAYTKVLFVVLLVWFFGLLTNYDHSVFNAAIWIIILYIIAMPSQIAAYRKDA